jgi:hypothetical protein
MKDDLVQMPAFFPIQLLNPLGPIGSQPPARPSGQEAPEWLVPAGGQGARGASLPVLAESGRTLQAQAFAAGGFDLGNLKGLADPNQPQPDQRSALLADTPEVAYSE